MRLAGLAAVPLVVVTLALAPPRARAKEPKASDLLLPAGYVPLTDAEKTMTSVPFAPGAPAVVLLDAAQYLWSENFVRTRRERRVKILTEGGLDEGTFAHTFRGEWRVNAMRARTVLPDGTEVDASENIHVETSKDPDMTVIKVTFPKVQPGAIVDFSLDANADSVFLGEHVPQEDIPVVESRLVVLPETGIRYRAGYARMKPEEVEASDFRYGSSMVYAWIFRNVPPLPDVPNMPPRGEISKTLLLIRDSYRYGDVLLPLAADWPSYCKELTRYWDEWTRKKAEKARALGAEVTAGAPTPRDKAEAVRKAVRSRMTSVASADWPSAESADEALAAGKGYTADAAGVAVAMLAGAGVQAKLAAYRHRSNGVLPTQSPVPSLFDDVLVLIPGAGAGGKDLYFCAWDDVAVGELPPDAQGVWVVPFLKDSPGPVLIPDAPPEGNAAERTVDLTLALDGTVTAQAMWTLNGQMAQSMRSELKRLSQEDRRKDLEDMLRATMPSATLANWQVDGLDDAGKDLTISLQWEATGLAQKAGSRMLINPFVFRRISASDWGAEKREQDIWLGRPYLRRDTVTIRLPQGVSEVQLPAPAKLEAPKVGGYVTTYAGKDNVLTSTRLVRFEQTLFPAASWEPLRSWFQDMAKGDDQAIVLTLADTAQ